MDFSSCCRMPSAWFIALNKYKEEACRGDAGREEEPAGAAPGFERELRWREWWGGGGGGVGGILNWEGGASCRLVRLRSCLPSTEVYLKYLATKWITVVYLRAADKQPGSFPGQSDLHRGLRASPLTWPGSPRTAGSGVLPVCRWEPFNCASFSRLLSYSAAGSRQHFLVPFYCRQHAETNTGPLCGGFVISLKSCSVWPHRWVAAAAALCGPAAQSPSLCWTHWHKASEPLNVIYFIM